MPQPVSDFWQHLRRARHQLEDRFLDHPDVSLIDIGLKDRSDPEKQPIVLRIHLKPQAVQKQPELLHQFPSQVNGIPVVIITADYTLEDGFPTGDFE